MPSLELQALAEQVLWAAFALSLTVGAIAQRTMAQVHDKLGPWRSR